MLIGELADVAGVTSQAVRFYERKGLLPDAERGSNGYRTYDESTPRAYAFYPGGTSLQRWHRALLRRLMEAEGFAVNPEEWWHFDYKDWRRYAIGNAAFDKIRRRG